MQRFREDRRAALRACVIWLGLLLACPAQAAELALGVLAYRGDAAARERWTPTADYLTRMLGDHTVRFVPLTLEGAQAALDAGGIDLLLTNPGHYRRLSATYRLSQLATLQTDRPGGQRTGNRYGAVIFTRAQQGGIRTLSDLKGRSFAAVSPEAFGGYQMAAQALMRAGVDPARDLGELLFLGFPQRRIVEMVTEGGAEAGTVRTGLLEAMIASGGLDPDAVRVLNPTRVPGFDLWLSTPVFPEWPMLAVAGMDDALRRRITLALLSMDPAEPAAVAGAYGGWMPPMNDDAVRNLLDELGRTAEARAGWLAWINLALGLALAGVAALALRRRAEGTRRRAAAAAAPAAVAEAVHLTPREREVLALIERGLTTKQIARDLDISPKTVEFHRGHLMRKFEVRNMAELVHKSVARQTAVAADNVARTQG